MKHVKLHLLLFFLLIIFILPVAAAGEPSNPQAATITVQGSGQTEVAPDEAIVTIGVVTTAQTASEAQANNATAATAVQQKILAAGIAAKNIRTSHYSVYPLYNDQEKGGRAPSITGYRITNTILVDVTDLSLLGTVIDSSLAAGANQISGLNFKKQDETQLSQTVLQMAVENATLKAKAIADSLGRGLGRAVSVTENGISIQSTDMMRNMVKGEGLSTPLNSGSIQINGTVTVVFEIN